MRLITKTVTALVFSALFSKAGAIEPFVVEDIQVEGLQRVELGTFFTELPIRVGEKLDDARAPSIIRAIHQTGNFDFVKLEKEGNVLKVTVVERPVITDIILKGNKVLKTEQLLEGMENAGISKGEVLDSFVLEKIEQEIAKQYYSNGHYHISVEKKLAELSRNRVQLHITINEGGSAKIKEFNIVGNDLFTDKKLLSQFELTTGGMFTFFTDDNKYNSDTLEKDLETLTSYYKDRGYLEFKINSTEISLANNEEDIYITIVVDEGEIYTISGIDIIGDFTLDVDMIRSMIPLKAGDTYSAAAMAFAEEQIKSLLGVYGYAFAEVRTIPEVSKDTPEAKLIVLVEPGERHYVDRISFEGNTSTNENVLRREVRVQEGGSLSSTLVERSKIRLQRLPYIENVQVETIKKEGTTDRADVMFKVKERSAAQISGGLGYNDFYGMTVNGELSHSNFLGSGNSVGLALNINKAIKSARLNYTDNYFTQDGIGLSTSLNYSETDYGKLNLVAQSMDTLGLGSTVYIPMGEYSTFSLGFNASKNTITSPITNTQRVIDFFDLLGYDARLDSVVDFDNFSVNLGYSINSLNRSIFPSNGSRHRYGLEVGTDVGDLEFYKATYDYDYYFPLSDNGWIFSIRGGLGYGDGYGDTEDLPYFQNFYGGGSSSLRGFETNTVGPRDLQRVRSTQSVPSPIPGAGNTTIVLPSEYDSLYIGRYSVGGNARFLNSFELIFPTPFIEDTSNVRTSFFVDVGNVWDTKFDPAKFQGLSIEPNSILPFVPDYSDYKDYRASYGISLQWYSAMGPLQFSLSRPLKSEPYDDTETFTFSIGQTF
ncbi:outer membrane protein assembly factor BamA [Kangiella koreensis]|uniref:Outer membrane protein assembly factor BamA n=1 Tax=Kangiella koreensis (strain DSM 16069 / JCM 12317 / KCTC 12182 / SW-125) TaxID=523791 RepID=C7R5Z0_KANKD|nr:outer membrane protein assembly factor BamA [Kangiella koreensis]ACV27314.1 outer membrane protein assembly complex, YaeT protein [Kangiella koreensis DSM 16069]